MVGGVVRYGIALVVERTKVGLRVRRSVLLSHCAHPVLPKRNVGRSELLNKGVAEVWLELLSEQGFLLLLGAGSHGRLDVALVGLEEAWQSDRPQLGCGSQTLLPTLRSLFGLEAPLGGSPGNAVDVLESAGHPPAISRPIFVKAHSVSFQVLATRMQALERRARHLCRVMRCLMTAKSV